MLPLIQNQNVYTYIQIPIHWLRIYHIYDNKRSTAYLQCAKLDKTVRNDFCWESKCAKCTQPLLPASRDSCLPVCLGQLSIRCKQAVVLVLKMSSYKMILIINCNNWIKGRKWNCNAQTAGQEQSVKSLQDAQIRLIASSFYSPPTHRHIVNVIVISDPA